MSGQGPHWGTPGLTFAAGMALHRLYRDGPFRGLGRRYSYRSTAEQLEQERRYPDNKFTQNAREADRMLRVSALAHAMPCHDRPLWFVNLSGTYGRPDGGHVAPHALHAMTRVDASSREQK